MGSTRKRSTAAKRSAKAPTPAAKRRSAKASTPAAKKRSAKAPKSAAKKPAAKRPAAKTRRSAPSAKRTTAAADSGLPKIGKPATRALAAIGVTLLPQVARMSRAELLAMHGVGPKAVRILDEALSARGLSFRASD